MMEFCDINVRVLYDFEYTTKYGRNIKISSGERLLLIKKTNHDWWQVIRSSEQRPFFVPATYVEEIRTTSQTANKNQSDTKCFIEKSHFESNTSITPEESDKNILDRPQLEKLEKDLCNPDTSSCLKEKYIVSDLKKDVSNTSPNKPLAQSNTMSSSGYNSLCEELPVFDDEDNISNLSKAIEVSNSSSKDGSGFAVIENKRHSKSYFDNRLYDVSVEPNAFDNMLSLERDNNLSTLCGDTPKSKVHVSIDKGKYSTVLNPTASVSEVSSLIVLPDLPASESLENLSLQIELKTKSLRNTSDLIDNSIPMSVVDVPGSSDHNVVNQKFLSSDGYNNVLKKESVQFSTKQRTTDLTNNKSKESRSSEDVCCNSQLRFDSSNLQYKGSFKTITERQKWLKKGIDEKRLRNVYSCSEESNIDLKPKSVSGFSESSYIPQDIGKGTLEDMSSMDTTCTVASVEELRTCKKTNEILRQSDYKAKVLQKKHPLCASDSQLTCRLRSDSEKTTSRHSLDSVVESELREICSEEFDHIKLKNKGLLLSNVLEAHKANSEKSSTDSLLDVENYGSFRKISGGTTSDSLVPTDGEDLFSSESETDSVKLAKRKQELKNIEHNVRKIPLARRRRVFSSKTRPELSLDPPSPETSKPPIRSLSEGWNEYDTHDGRKYFYNLQTKEKRWKPPRRNQTADVEVKEEHDSGDAAEDDMFVVSLPLPKGWQSDLDTLTGQTCYVNAAGGARWFSSTDNEGRLYFFEENTDKSSWTLPESQVVDNNEDNSLESVKSEKININLYKKKSTNLPETTSMIDKSIRYKKSKSMIFARSGESSPLPSLAHNWPQLSEGTMCVLKEGPLNKTKITENGKRVRKNWTSTYAVLTELQLLFFKDNKGFRSMMSGQGRPELSVDLNGALIDPGDKVSSRKNVYMLNTVLGLQVLIQSDCPATTEQWLHAIQAAINKLPSSLDGKSPRSKGGSPFGEENPRLSIIRSKSLLKYKSESIEDISVNVAERQTKIKERLKKFFHRRPSVEQLVKKGIWKDEPVFGCLLETVCPHEEPRVPEFVQECIRCIESSEENMKTDGLYRASGNLSQVQKIRFQVDQNIYALLKEEDDVHVLSGTLKLFFRELKQPLIPFKFFKKALNASTNQNRKEKIKDFRDIVKALPSCNYDTLKFLLKHLLRVSEYQEYNRMHIPNIAIVFGPTLMWPEQESLNMAFDLMQQNLVIECFLSEFKSIFP